MAASLASKITPDMFTESRFRSAQDKCREVRALARFIESGFAPAKFTKAAYDCCYQSFDFIAHYDRHGFLHYYFEGGPDSAGAMEFLGELRRHVASRADLDPERNSDMAAVFDHGGILAPLIGNEAEDPYFYG